MDTKLHALWQSNLPPFDGSCLYLDDLVPIANLRLFLLSAFNVLKQLTNNGELFKFDDWHEHDGFVTKSILVPIEEVEGIMVSDESLYASRHGDTFVRWAFYPNDIAFLLRYYILDEDEDHLYSGIWGTCDLTADNQTLEKIKDLADDTLANVISIGKAKDYFDRNFAG